ncbi:hypothetical protein CFP56_013997 [Quercus suber]|uniref:Uncharacterized protein n=1 Tax=Quercus suber TaxID=58331 RepID=A0AAW0KV21_QUESU
MTGALAWQRSHGEFARGLSHSVRDSNDYYYYHRMSLATSAIDSLLAMTHYVLGGLSLHFAIVGEHQLYCCI